MQKKKDPQKLNKPGIRLNTLCRPKILHGTLCGPQIDQKQWETAEHTLHSGTITTWNPSEINQLGD